MRFGGCEDPKRKESQGIDSAFGVGFNCTSRESWQKPRIYWMHQNKGIRNSDLRISILVPYDFKTSIFIYMLGIEQDRHYTVNTDTPCKEYGIQAKLSM